MNAEKLKARREAKRQAKELARIEAEKNQKAVESVTIKIEWKKSQMWGSNPNCEAEVHYKDGTFERSPIFKCSGCGYDKESTVISDVFNHYLKYKLYQFSDEDKNKPYGIYLNDYKHYSGGIGTSCYYQIAEFIGGKFEHIASGNTFDVYKYTDLI